MLLTSTKAVVLTEEEIKNAIRSLAYKQLPDIRPSGISQNDDVINDVTIIISSDRSISARVVIESKSEEVCK